MMPLKKVIFQYTKESLKARDRQMFDLLRLLKDYDIKDISAATGLSKNTLRKWWLIDGGTRHPRMSSYERCLAALGMKFTITSQNSTSNQTESVVRLDTKLLKPKGSYKNDRRNYPIQSAHSK